MPGFHAELREVEKMTVQLRRAARNGEREVFVSVLAIGEEVKVASKAIAAQHSKSIPPTIRSKPIPSRSVEISAGEGAPLAALYELGNKGSKRTSKTFRHPVYGRDVWVEQPRYRFFAPARAMLARKIKTELTDAWKRAMHREGIKVETR